MRGGGVLIAVALLAGPGVAAADVAIRVREATGRIAAVPLERYVERAVAGEVYASWPAEALRAQAVIARTYALHERAARRDESFDVDATVLSQRYRRGAVAPSVRRAVAATQGQVLLWGGGPILAAFHASSGGHTASAEEVWGEPLPYLRSVASPDEAAPDYFWSYEIPFPALRAALAEAGFGSEGPDDVAILERSGSGRVSRMRIAGTELRGRDLREVLGGRAIRSTRFDVRRRGDQVTFLGSGAGHGVGLCQWGTRELARRGRSYREILSHYYPGASLGRWPSPGVRRADAR